MLTVGTPFGTNSSFCCPKYGLSIIRVDHFTYSLYQKGSACSASP